MEFLLISETIKKKTVIYDINLLNVALGRIYNLLLMVKPKKKSTKTQITSSATS